MVFVFLIYFELTANQNQITKYSDETCIIPHAFIVLASLCGVMLVVSERVAALPIVERVGLVTGDFRVLGGEGGADLPEKKDRPCGYQLG